MSLRDLFWRLFQVSGNVDAYLTYSTFNVKLERSGEGSERPAAGAGVDGPGKERTAGPTQGGRG